MTAALALLVVMAVVAQLLLPRAWAAAPIIATACFVPIDAAVAVGPFSFYVLRLVLLAAFVRIFFSAGKQAGKFNALDWLVAAWSAVALLSSLFADDLAATLVNRLGLVYTNAGTYFVLRAVCRSAEDVLRLLCITVALLIPVAACMLYEKATGSNLFSLIGGDSPWAELRDGVVRARGPFAHAILAGSIGATCLPLAAAIWSSHRRLAVAGIAAGLTMVYASASTGPVMSMAFAIAAIGLWRWRQWTRSVRWSTVGGYVLLDIVMNAPAYHLLTRIDLTGSSTSWHRAALIDTAIAHWSEWWLVGTSYTRHWLPYGVPWSGDQIDITNYYLRMGVDGGLPLMLLFIAVLAKAFQFVGQTVRRSETAAALSPFVVWALGASLFANAVSFISVSYFDQSVVFLYLTLAAIGAAYAREEPEPADHNIAGMYGDPACVPQ